MLIGDLIVKIKKFGIENIFRRYYSIYPGIVVDNLDEKKRGRIQVKVPDIMGEIELTNWAEPISLSAGKDANGSFGIFYPPKIGDYVWIQFRMGDINAPLYMGGWWAKDEMPEYLSDDKKNAIFISRFGHHITVDEAEENANFKIEMNDKKVFEINVGKKFMKLIDANNNGFVIDLDKMEWTNFFEGKLIENIKKEVEQTFESTLKTTVTKAVEQIFNDKMTVTVSKDGEISCGGKVIVKASSNGSFFGTSATHIGAESGTYSAVLGELILQSLNTFITIFNSHIHTGNLGAPTSPPAPSGQPIPTSVLSKKVKLV